MYKFTDVSELLYKYKSLEWESSSVTSTEFMPIFIATGLNMKSVLVSTSVSGRLLFVTCDFNDVYYVIDYITNDKVAGIYVSDSAKTLYNLIKGEFKL